MSCSVHDIVNLESGGVPGVMIASNEFVEAATAQAGALGADPARVFVAHPIQDRTADELRAVAVGARDVDQLRHGVAAKMLVPVPWSPLKELDLATVPTNGDHPLTLFMEDTAWPYEGGLEEYLEAARTNYAPSLAEGGRTGRSLLELQAVFRPAWGAGRWREVVLWQKVTQLKAITPLVTTEVPAEYRAPGTWMHDALEVRDDWESKLLRTTAWSPLF